MSNFEMAETDRLISFVGSLFLLQEIFCIKAHASEGQKPKCKAAKLANIMALPNGSNCNHQLASV